MLASRTISSFRHAFPSNAAFILAFAFNDATPREGTPGPGQTQGESCDLMSLMMMYRLLHWLYCNIHRKGFLPAWKIQHLHRLTKWDKQMCAAWTMHVSGYELFLLGLPELLAVGFVLLLAVNISKRSVGVHFVRREHIKKKKKKSPDSQDLRTKE